MELYQLRHFVAVAETESFTKGAERCNVTQPALSGSIAKLEEDLGAKLFFRTNRVVSLTEAGQKLLAKSVSILAACGQVREEIRGAGGAKPLKIGLVQTFPTHKLMSLLTSLRDDLAGLDIEIIEGTAPELDEHLAMRKIDVGLSILSSESLDSANEIPLFRDRYLLYAASTNPLAGRPEIELADLADQPFVVRSTCEIYEATMALLRNKGISPKIACRTLMDDRALEMVRAGFGVSVMPEVFEVDGVKKIPISDLQVTPVIGLKLGDQRNELVKRFGVFARTHTWHTHGTGSP